MSDWAVGDLAVCVDAGPCRNPPSWTTAHRLISELEAGKTYVVSDIRISNCGTPALRFPGFDFRTETGEMAGFGTERFRKVLPDKHEACDSEFVDLLNRSKVPTETIVTVDRDGRAYLRDAA